MFQQVDIIANENSQNGEEKAIFGIFIKNVVPNSPAAQCGDLKVRPFYLFYKSNLFYKLC